MNWTTTQPMQDGWYWARPESEVYREACDGGVDLIYVYEDTEICMMLAIAAGFAVNTPLVDFTHFMGPLLIPETPPPSPTASEGGRVG